MTAVERFMDDTVDEMRHRLALLDDGGDRVALEDGIALLTDYRVSTLDEPGFERLLAAMRAGRSPVRLIEVRPEAIAVELEARWVVWHRAQRERTSVVQVGNGI